MAGARAYMKVDLKALAALDERFAAAAKWMRGNKPGADRVAQQAAQILVGKVRERLFDSASARSTVSGRTGALARSFRERVEITARTMKIAAESDLVYARIQDKGGRIFPRTVKRLAIPLQRMAVGKWPRNWPRGELFRRGNALSRRVGSWIKNVYALVESVKIRPKHYTRDAAQQAKPEVAALMVSAMLKEVADGG